MFEDLITSITLIKIQIQSNLPILGIILVIPWAIYLFSSCISKKILLLGIIPRRLIGLPGIVFAPLLHANFNHIFFNSIPLVVLSCFILINGLHYYLIVTFLITILSGIAIWCFAKNGLHIGASALITGYWSFLVVNIYQRTTPITIILGLISLYYFAGIFLGIFPKEKGVSWQGHLYGLLAGIATSYIVKLYPQLLI
ncbi:rhomboid family intramembrane serine protease [Legionella sp. km772]|uniref:rhomboid family intramembrane serine protease n=1 Tax=Legionella sp. km772 TaxID=2498111 RepID=UPI000F8D2789|nr:rhomboid family intramembrane serine protease [Legionella sp. km772]RUR12083.1 rhomboid family intramembrane serine protease [Legionella sp. km772]